MYGFPKLVAIDLNSIVSSYTLSWKMYSTGIGIGAYFGLNHMFLFWLKDLFREFSVGFGIEIYIMWYTEQSW